MSGTNGSNGKISALPFQRQTIYRAEELGGRHLNANDTGLGKTYTSLWFVKRKTLGETLPLLVICPRTVRGQWVQAIKEVLGVHPDILESRTPSDVDIGPSGVAIINYDVIAWWRDWLESQGFQTLILDESQAYTNPKTKRTVVATALARQTRFCLALSATPLTNRPIELWPIIHALNPKYWHNKGAYAHRYCGPKFGRWGWEFKGASNLDELNTRLNQSVMTRYTKDEVLGELPNKVRQVITVELRDFDQYKRAERDFLGWLKETYPERMSKSIKALAVVKSGHLLRLAAKLKMPSVIEWINYKLEQTDEKMIVFGYHKKCIEVLNKRIKQKSVIIDGSVTGAKREQAQYQFQTDKKTRVLIGSTAASVGLNLQCASLLCVTELMQKPGPHLQLEGRIHRMGQDLVSWVYYMIGAGTIEESVSKLVQKKQRNITATLDGADADPDFDLYDQLIEELEIRMNQ